MGLLISKTAVLGRFGNQVFKQILEEGSRHPYFATLSLGEISLRFLNSPLGTVDFQNGRVQVQLLFRKEGTARERPQKGLKLGWSETPSGSPSQTLYMLLRLQHHCFILFFINRKDVFFLYVLVSLPDHFEGQWLCLPSASFPGKGQSPVSAPKRVSNRSETTLKHLPAHHLRLYASSVTASLLYFAF